MANVFTKAKVIEATDKPKTKADKKQRIALDGLEDLAMVNALKKNLETIETTLRAAVDAQMSEYFSSATGKRPENFVGFEGSASGSAEMRKRSSRSPLNDGEVIMLESDGIPVGTDETVPERFVVNPAFAGDSKLLEKVSKALQTVKGLPEDFILVQPAETRRIVTDETIDAVFAKGLARKYIDTVAVLALKPKLETTDISATMAKVKKLLEV